MRIANRMVRIALLARYIHYTGILYTATGTGIGIYRYRYRYRYMYIQVCTSSGQRKYMRIADKMVWIALPAKSFLRECNCARCGERDGGWLEDRHNRHHKSTWKVKVKVGRISNVIGKSK